jgi:ribosomal subunit interface protein
VQVPIQIHCHGFPRTQALEDYVREHVAKLEALSRDIVSCRIALEIEDPRHKLGRHHRVRIDVVLPHKELVVNRTPPASSAHADPYAAIDDAFDDMARSLRRHVDRVHRDVKTHTNGRSVGVVKKLFAHDRYGFLSSAAPDETGVTSTEDVYFHASSVADDAFDRLAVGARVHYVEETTEQGPRARLVVLRH